MLKISPPAGIILLLLLNACAPAPQTAVTNTTVTAPPTTVAAAPISPSDWLERARARGTALWPMAAASQIAVTVRRGGALARLGHDHVVAARALQGWAHPGGQGEPARAAFRFRLDAMVVDDAALRAQAGLETTPSDDAIAGTRRNMLVKVLDAERYPEVLVQAVEHGPGMLRADITLHGVTRSVTIPAQIVLGTGGIGASGEFTLRQSDFGITPFAVLGGALAVRDEMELRFAISARP